MNYNQGVAVFRFDWCLWGRGRRYEEEPLWIDMVNYLSCFYIAFFCCLSGNRTNMYQCIIISSWGYEYSESL
jgi:hypothetical protein